MPRARMQPRIQSRYSTYRRRLNYPPLYVRRFDLSPKADNQRRKGKLRGNVWKMLEGKREVSKVQLSQKWTKPVNLVMPEERRFSVSLIGNIWRRRKGTFYYSFYLELYFSLFFFSLKLYRLNNKATIFVLLTLYSSEISGSYISTGIIYLNSVGTQNFW